jgi:hypothetical protein
MLCLSFYFLNDENSFSNVYFLAIGGLNTPHLGHSIEKLNEYGLTQEQKA